MTTNQEMQELLIHAVQKSTAEVFATMLGWDVEVGDIAVNCSSPVSTEGVVSLIGLTGPWIGTGSISCDPQVACKISGALLMSEYAVVDEEVLDAIAEVTNMVLGNTKTILEENVGSMGLSIPTVIYGRNFSAKSAGGSGWTIVPFQCGADQVLVQVCLVRNAVTNPHLAAVR